MATKPKATRTKEAQPKAAPKAAGTSLKRTPAKDEKPVKAKTSAAAEPKKEAAPKKTANGAAPKARPSQQNGMHDHRSGSKRIAASAGRVTNGKGRTDYEDEDGHHSVSEPPD